MSGPEKKIVLFDDDEDILSICTFVLEEDGWKVHSFTDCNDIAVRVKNIAPDVILMDNWIPEAGGIVATQTLKNDPVLKTIPVIYFSANNDIQRLTEAARADDYLAKPFDLEELLKLVAKFETVQ